MLDLLIRAGNPLISIETADEERAVERVRAVAKDLGLPLCEWSITEGIVRVQSDGRTEKVLPGARPISALAHVAENLYETLYLFKDLGPHCRDAHVHRMIRDLLPLCTRRKAALIMIDALPLPEEIRRFAVAWDLPHPDLAELEEIVKSTFQRLRRQDADVSAKLTRGEMDQIVQSLRGLGAAETERVVAAAILHDKSFTVDDLPHIIEAKRTLLRSAGCLESIAVDFRPEDIGGLDNLKQWLAHRRGGFSRKAREFGLEPPRGVLMLGVPGSGKSLCAKVVAADWRMPLLRLDPGVLYQKFIGESESQLRQALRQAEAMAPVVLWIDEIEKAFASASAASADGGLSKRMFGTLLSWMQDHRHPIFIIATANDIAALPPELMRKGRFDEVFFVDLPHDQARREIFRIHLRRRKRDPAQYDIDRLADVAEGFTGSEIEQAIVAAMFTAFAEERELTDEHIEASLRATRPLYVLMAEQIAALRAWAVDRCVPAD